MTTGLLKRPHLADDLTRRELIAGGAACLLAGCGRRGEPGGDSAAGPTTTSGPTVRTFAGSIRYQRRLEPLYAGVRGRVSCASCRTPRCAVPSATSARTSSSARAR